MFLSGIILYSCLYHNVDESLCCHSKLCMTTTSWVWANTQSGTPPNKQANTCTHTEIFSSSLSLTLGSEDHPTASSVCCGWRNTPCHCPDASLWRQMGQKEHAQWAQRFLENSTLDGIRGITWPRGEEEKNLAAMREKQRVFVAFRCGVIQIPHRGKAKYVCVCVCQSDHRHTAESVHWCPILLLPPLVWHLFLINRSVWRVQKQ